jgi:hypothetical protein
MHTSFLRIPSWLLALVAIVLGLGIAPVAEAGRLSGARGSAHGSSRSSSGGGGSSGSSYRGGYCYGPYGYGYSPYGSTWWGLRTFGAPWWLPYSATGDHFERPYAFPSAPYADGADGYVRIQGVTPGVPDPDPTAHPGRQLLGNSVAVRLSTEGSYIDADLQRYSASLLISTSERFELGTEWSLFSEHVLPGDPHLPQGGVDHLVMGTVDASLLFAQSQYAQFRTGLGLRTLLDPVGGNEYGINLLYGMDFYPTRPLVISMRGDVGTVGDALIARARATLGVVIGHTEIYGGYDKTWISNAELGGGPVLGVRLWN